jgi:hypothetical protein
MSVLTNRFFRFITETLAWDIFPDAEAVAKKQWLPNLHQFSVKAHSGGGFEITRPFNMQDYDQQDEYGLKPFKECCMIIAINNEVYGPVKHIKVLENGDRIILWLDTVNDLLDMSSPLSMDPLYEKWPVIYGRKCCVNNEAVLTYLRFRSNLASTKFYTRVFRICHLANSRKCQLL